MSEFKEQLSALINRHNRESNSDTPDFILAEYLSRCLEAFDWATRRRESWYGLKRPGDAIPPELKP